MVAASADDKGTLFRGCLPLIHSTNGWGTATIKFVIEGEEERQKKWHLYQFVMNQSRSF